MKNVYAIVDEAIREAGGDGLVSEECGCELGDLVPCGEDFSECVIAKKQISEEKHWIMVPLGDRAPT